jgi:metal-responsive CopG/Arc/MetJ family transcriptional regulator
MSLTQDKGDITMARVLISMPEEFLSRIDEVADGENRSRSELIREALRTYIHKQKVRDNAVATKNASILEALLD